MSAEQPAFKVPTADMTTEVFSFPEKIEEPGEGIVRIGTEMFASVNSHITPIESELGGNIAIALRMQEKIDDAIMSGSRPGLLRMVSMLNCRKAISAVRGTTPLNELVSRQKLDDAQLSVEDLEELSGLPDLKVDLHQIIESGRIPALGSKEDMHIASYLDDHPEDLPVVVHVFDVLPRYEQEMVSKLFSTSSSFSVNDCMQKMHRNHTFLVIGKDAQGKYICFQKQGPEVHHRFELRELSSLLDLSVDPLDDSIHLSFIGPATVKQPADASV